LTIRAKFIFARNAEGENPMNNELFTELDKLTDSTSDYKE
jgi:hypothetical protein